MLIERGLPCKWCRSSDAFTEYEESYYCFSCEGFEKKKTAFVEGLVNKTESADEEVKLPKDTLNPFDVTEALCYLYQLGFVREWASKYDIRYGKNVLLYSKRKEKWYPTGPRLIFPYYEDYQLKFWEGKSLEDHPLKSIGEGGKQQMYKIISEHSDTVILCEDILSTIKVAESTGYSCYALRGTSFNLARFAEIKKDSHKTIIIWLDGDEAGQKASRKIYEKLKWCKDTHRILTKKDPKWYTKQEIREIVEGGFDD
jgi:5S rRNA maturation endonuclease (ribonuclease M5)